MTTVGAAPRRTGRPLSDPSSVPVPELQKLIERVGIKKSWIAWELGIDAALISTWSRGLRFIPSKYLDPLGALLKTRFVVRNGVAYSGVYAPVPDPDPDEDRSATVATPSAVAEPHRPEETVSPPASSAPAPPRRRRGIDIGINGSPMGPGASHTYCSCGRRVR